MVKRKLALAVAAAVVAVGSFTGATVAWAGFNGGAVYDTGNQCVYNQTWMNAGWNQVSTLSLTDEPWFGFPNQNCTYENHKPGGYLASYWEYYIWLPVSQAWVVCGRQGWEYGGGARHDMGRGTTGCGDGWYHMWGGSFVYNGGWRGGWVLINTEWLNF